MVRGVRFPSRLFMKNMDDKEIIQLYEELTNNLIAVIQCLNGDAPCVKMIQDAMEIKAKIDGATTKERSNK